jgi:hypothetical protein
MNNSDDYTLTELQPVESNRQFPQDAFQSSLDTADENANIEPAALTEAGVPDDEEEVLLNDEEEVLLNDEEDSEELSEQQRCLKLNRKYQVCDVYLYIYIYIYIVIGIMNSGQTSNKIYILFQ